MDTRVALVKSKMLLKVFTLCALVLAATASEKTKKDVQENYDSTSTGEKFYIIIFLK